MSTYKTGEMIDKLLVGQIAIGHHSNNEKLNERVTKLNAGHIWRVDEMDKEVKDGCVRLTGGFVQDLIWTILPIWVSFEEAMVILRKGEVVCCHLDEGDIHRFLIEGNILHEHYYANGKWTPYEEQPSINEGMIIEGKWTRGDNHI